MEDQQIKKAVFVDRDGTLIEEVNFLSKVEDLRIFDYTYDSIKLLKNAGYHVIVITNQSGIARGFYDTEAMHTIHRQMQKELDDMIDAFYFCPHLPDAGCRCRKPNPGMIESANNDLSIEMNGSWVVGDKKLDVQTGQKAGLRTGLVRTGYGSKHESELETPADITADTLALVVQNILANGTDQ